MDPDQLASEEPADLDLNCFHSKIYPSLIWKGLTNSTEREKCSKLLEHLPQMYRYSPINIP